MARPNRIALIAVSVVVLLLASQIGVSAKKKSSKRKSRAARSAKVIMVPVQRALPVIVSPPVITQQTPPPAVANDTLLNMSAPGPRGSSSSAPASGSGNAPSIGEQNGNNKNRWIARPSITAATGLIISEFRVRGPNPNGAENEFIEIYNNSGADHTVDDSGAGTGYAVAASDGMARCIIPDGTVIPSRGHFLCTNSVGYSLAGNTTGDATYTTDIPDNAGIALFDTTVAANFTLANRFDAVGSTSEANTLYKEGTGYPALTPFSIDYSFSRDQCGKGGSITVMGPCPVSTPKDTDNNATDFYFVDTNGTSAGAGQRLGAPGPENLASPIQRNSSIIEQLVDATVVKSNPPNRVRDFTSDPANNSTFGTLDIRRRIVNNTGAAITRLRFRVIDITTFPAPSGIADLRPRSSTLVVVSGINDSATCLAATGVATTPCTISVQGTTLEQPPSQPNGGGFNSTVSAGTVTLGTPLANGSSINVRFLLGIQQTGSFKFYMNVEALP